jgi:GNAT superfamily N-acetyltransferase
MEQPGAGSVEGRVQVRLAEIQDAEAVTSLINAAFRKAESFLIDRDRIDAESVRALLEKGKFLVAENPVAQDQVAESLVTPDRGDNRDVFAGCVYVELRGERAYLGLLSVDPQRQKAGLGSMLMEAAENYCAKSGCSFMDLRIVNVRRELPSFYRRRGYVETGTTPFPPDLNPKVPCHFVEMSKPLV